MTYQKHKIEEGWGVMKDEELVWNKVYPEFEKDTAKLLARSVARAVKGKVVPVRVTVEVAMDSARKEAHNPV